jgi:hypothetical protein
MIFRPLAIALLGVTACVPLLQAQRGGVRIGSGPHFGIQAGPQTAGFRSGRFARGASSLFLGDPFLLDYSDYQPYATVATQPQIVIVPAAPAPPEPAPARLEPLMIEWRGDRYVRIANNVNSAPPDYVAPSSSAPVSPHSSLPALLIFRDGNRQEVMSYTIVGDSLYTDADRWVSGAWSKKIALASLDVASTLRANQERGVPFHLPTSPNEVMVRP